MRVLQRSDLERVLSGSGGRILIACDFDGTLAPIVPFPSLARLPESTATVLQALIDTGRVTLAILSGRSLADLRERVDLPCILGGNHGLEISGGGIDYVHPDAAERAGIINEAQEIVQSCLAAYRGAWVENKRLTATVHFRQVDGALRYRLVWDVRHALRSFGLTIGMRAGKCSLELHPRVGWDKGRALEYIRDAMGLRESVCIVFGDDTTDESMFRSPGCDITVRVGPAVRTAARFSLPSPAAVSNVLEHSLDFLMSCSSPLARAAV